MRGRVGKVAHFKERLLTKKQKGEAAASKRVKTANKVEAKKTEEFEKEER